jgi:hypothetical protein
MAFFEGKFARAFELTQSNLDLYDEEAHRDHALIFAGHDPGVCASCFNSLALLMVGHPDQALTGADRSLALAHKRAHPPTLAHALRYTGDIYHLVRSHDALLRHADAVFALPEEQRSGLASKKWRASHEAGGFPCPTRALRRSFGTRLCGLP